MDERLFREESGRLIAALTRIFGVKNLALAEDVVQDAFTRALEVWATQGRPDNPRAWLLTTAKNRALDVLRRERTAKTFAPDLGRLIESEWTLAPAVEELFGPGAIRDDELRMMFSCCHPRLSQEVQVALVLHILCGFTVNQIAAAFFDTRAAVEKRIARGKKVLAASRTLFELKAGSDFLTRLAAVQRAIYLLFNEGYHGAGGGPAVRVDLCREALRLSLLLVDHPLTATPASCALASLVCLHAARLPERIDDEGHLTSLAEHDRTRWDERLLAEGHRLLEESAVGDEVTEYHLESAIAALHAGARDLAATDWRTIVTLYDQLMRLRPSPVVALNRAIAIAQVEGPSRGIDEIRAITGAERLAKYPFYAAALAELELRRGETAAAEQHFREALSLARNPMERRFLEQRLGACALRS